MVAEPVSFTAGPQQVLVLHIGQVSKKLRERAATGEDLCRFKYWSIEQNSIVKDVYLFPIGYTAIVVYQREFYVLYITEHSRQASVYKF